MRFTKEVTLNQPFDKVRALTADPEHVHHWQPDLVSITRHSDTTATLAYDSKGRKFQLEETVLAATPDERTSRYVTKGMTHTITNRYVAIDERTTKLVCDNEVEFTGLMKLGGKLIAGTIKEQSERNIDNFKTYVDGA